MKTDRNIHQLYKVLYREFIKDQRAGINFGICYKIGCLPFLGSETYDMYRHIYANRPLPAVNSEFFIVNHPDMILGFWWPLSPKGRQQRIKFLRKMIHITRPEPLIIRRLKSLYFLITCKKL